MGKRATVLDVNYNPVGSRLQRVISPLSDLDQSLTVPQDSEPLDQSKPTELDEGAGNSQSSLTAMARSQPKAGERREIMSSEIRVRCTNSERKKWQDFAYRLTGEPNTFSHIFRALLVLLEHAEEDFGRMSELVRLLTKPPKNDPLQVALFEHKIAQILWESMRRSGRVERK
ncbi:hypothetical protein NIES2135_65060 (plasmid) [Leptolyngbya boryana NIES-2135]|jgi:hypothetical protein|uniref:Uncharacterized protein n=1 Tax=Leptolyngbya boryana NIES-2135 TaxID=1973484 RepID=A0A1Z4JSB3_LEPBY|nr:MULTISPECIES: hypothetical protein [Leptolyngbya]BAY59629.1 hypothetical protein NIES2135_65060 [Leptolyngbya boryana NIES-2135]MBD2371188.1 hypothetical protein [Leptolyngbya sp. FACHB-161]MBD2377848.1 hypothetical protein [Leptolyngbya sp. FACHB-238]MBD2402286.1 hypothetical protein [Leptolyngbya sp. FACHB-239]MBD2409029.1 hypothetical protein [Leptolyngbya sp. FACHB-402]